MNTARLNFNKMTTFAGLLDLIPDRLVLQIEEQGVDMDGSNTCVIGHAVRLAVAAFLPEQDPKEIVERLTIMNDRAGKYLAPALFGGYEGDWNEFWWAGGHGSAWADEARQSWINRVDAAGGTSTVTRLPSKEVDDDALPEI